MPRRPPVGLVSAALLAASCSSGTPAVDVRPVEGLSVAAQATCRAVSDALPAEVAEGVRRRTTSPVDPTVAAWGDPPVVLRCGVPAGSALDDPYGFDGVRWAMHDTGDSRTWTTLDRAVNVEVVVPDHYSGQAELLGGLAQALAPTGVAATAR